MLGDGGVIAARGGAGPCRAGTVLFKVVEHLAHQRQQGLDGVMPRKPKLDQQLRGGFGQGQRVARDERARGVILGLAATGNGHGNSAESARHGLGRAPRARIAFDCEDQAFQIRPRIVCNVCIGSIEPVAAPQRAKHAIPCYPARHSVQHHFAAGTYSRQASPSWRATPAEDVRPAPLTNDIGIHDFARGVGARLSGANRAHRSADVPRSA